MKILITTKSHLVPLLSQQKRMKWSGTDFGWWMHSTYPKIKVDESLVEPKNVYVLCIAAVQQTNGSVLFCFWCISNFTALFDEIRGNWEENRMKENSYTMQCETKSKFVRRKSNFNYDSTCCCICIFSWLNHFSTTTTSLEIPTLDFGQYISVLDVRCILNLPQIPYTIYMCIWKPKICRPSQRCTLEIIELIWGKLIKLHSKHRNFLYFSF